jgi:predicted N-acyltransferase
MKVEFAESIKNIDEDVWNKIVNSDYPFLNYSFLLALEDTKCVGEGTGWYPFHLLIKENKEIIALMPMYLKTDSHGEFIFDWSWADAYYRNGMEYYPKLVSAIPFTPASGPRLCSLSEENIPELVRLIKEAIEEISTHLKLSSAHVLLPEYTELEHFMNSGFSLRTSYSFHWFNNNYKGFNDFLNGLTSRQRKNIKKERMKILDQNITIEKIEGKNITETLWNDFFNFYQVTYLKRGMSPYLNLDFFLKLTEIFPDNLLLVVAKDLKNNKPVAGALNFYDSKVLYGRYWGCLEQYDSMHFECCYYQGIEYCIEKGINKFDPGVQGEHKIKRGFLPIETYSAHWIKDTRFRKAIDNFLIEERANILDYKERCKSLLPFKDEVVNKIYTNEKRIKS